MSLLRDHQAEAWLKITEACLELGMDHTEPGAVACEQTINWIRRHCANLATAKVRDGLATRFPGRTISVGEVAWYEWNNSGRYSEFTISIQPGLDGYPNQNFSGNTLQEALVKFNLAATNYGQ